jgi:hypothetical protein
VQNRRSLGGDGKKLFSGYAVSSSLLSRISLTQGEGWGGMDEASAWWMDEIHPISTGDEVSST